MRIIGGHCKGRKLVPLAGQRIRPTSDRVREAVFNILGPRVLEASVLDLFAGTGALGLEALSRGANHATFIDLNCDTIHQNLKRCRCEENARVIACDIIKSSLPKELAGQQFDLVFIDPPYGKGYIELTLQKESFADLLGKDCIVIAEHACRETLGMEHSSLDIYRQKKYSKTMISLMTKN